VPFSLKAAQLAVRDLDLAKALVLHRALLGAQD
jgi:hypothetical protein